MTNPLLKVTLILLSLVSAVLVGQVFLYVTQTPSSSMQGLSVDTPGVTNTDFELASVQAQQGHAQNPGRQSAPADSALTQDPSLTAPRHSTAQEQSSRRSFSFHYLDILEWLFAGRGEKTKPHQAQRPSTSLSVW